MIKYPFYKDTVVRALKVITEGGGDTPPDHSIPAPKRGGHFHKSYVHGTIGDLGVVEGVDGNVPTVRFWPKKTATVVGKDEVELLECGFTDTATDAPFLGVDRPVGVCRSAAGYYIGQMEPCGVPLSRLSDIYYTSFDEADKALHEGWPGGRMENKRLELELLAIGAIAQAGKPGMFKLVVGEN